MSMLTYPAKLEASILLWAIILCVYFLHKIKYYRKTGFKRPLKKRQNKGLKDIEILAIILVLLIMTLSRGHTASYWEDQKGSDNEVIMTSLQGQ